MRIGNNYLFESVYIKGVRERGWKLEIKKKLRKDAGLPSDMVAELFLVNRSLLLSSGISAQVVNMSDKT